MMPDCLPSLFDSRDPKDVLAMTHAISGIHQSLHESHPEISMYFLPEDIIKIVEIYIVNYQHNLISHRIFINNIAYNAVATVYPGMIKEHFNLTINTFITLYMTYKLTEYYNGQEDSNIIEQCVWNILRQGFDPLIDISTQLSTDIIQIKKVDQY